MNRREREAWLIVASLFVSLFFLWGSGYNTVGIFVTPLVREFGWSRAQVSLLFAVLALASGLSSPVAGWLVDRMEAKILIAVGAAVSCAGLLIASRANTLRLMLLAYAVLGAGLGCSTFVPASLVVSNWFGTRRGLALGVVMGGQSLGGMVMTQVASYVVSSKGWRMGDVTLAIPMLVLVIPSVLMTVRTRPAASIVKNTNVSITDRPPSVPGLEVKEALRTRSFWMLALAQLCYPFAISGPFVHLVAYLLGVGYGERVSALSLSLLLGFAALGQPLMGVVADRIGGRLALAATFGGLGASLVLLLVPRPALLLLFVLFFGLLVSAPIALIPMILAQSLGLKRFGSLSGLIGFPFTIGLAAGPLVAGRIYDVTASYFNAFELCIAITAIGIVAALACKPLDQKTVSVAAAEA